MTRTFPMSALFATLAAVATAQTPPDASRFTLHASPYGVCSHLAGGERDARARTFAAMQVAGIGMVRCDFWWSEVEHDDGSFDFSLTDAIVADAKAAGVTVLPILLNVHPAHPKPFEDDVPWRRYVRAVAERYASDCPVFEVWNEPNHGQNGHGCQNPTNYVKVLKAASEEIRSAAPGARVALGGLSGAAEPARTFLKEVFLLGGGDCIDIVNVHPYCIPNTPEYHYASKGGFPRLIRALEDECGVSRKAIWVTEFGWPTNDTDPAWPAGTKEFRSKVGVDENRQSACLARGLGCLFAEGVEVVMPYELRDRGGSRFDRESRFGLLRENFAPKPAFSAYATFIAMRPAGSEQMPGPYSEGGNDGLFFPQWLRPDGVPAGMLWLGSGAERRTLRFAARPENPSSLRFFDREGREVFPDATDDGNFALDLSGSPIYFLGGFAAW